VCIGFSGSVMFVCVLWSEAGPGNTRQCLCVLVFAGATSVLGGMHGAAPIVWLSHNNAVVTFVLCRQQRHNACMR
jgi:hypothetical protein